MENQYNFNDPQSYVPLLASAIVGAATLTVIQMLTGNSDKNPDGNAKNIIPSSSKKISFCFFFIFSLLLILKIE